jgi:hypothetical protein
MLLWLVIQTDQSLLRTYKRVQSLFTDEDADVLAFALEPFRQLVTTPHVLTEVCNFLDHAPVHRRDDLFESLRAFVQGNEEWYETARRLSEPSYFATLGIADSGLVAASQRATIVTLDWRLAGKIEALGGQAINFNHVRRERAMHR